MELIIFGVAALSGIGGFTLGLGRKKIGIAISIIAMLGAIVSFAILADAFRGFFSRGEVEPQIDAWLRGGSMGAAGWLVCCVIGLALGKMIQAASK